MSSDLFDLIESSAQKMGSCEPLWLKDRREPEFKVFTAPGGGNGPVMVLLHGLFGAMSNWEDSMSLFAEFSTPIALEFPILTNHRSEVRVKALAAYTEYYVRKFIGKPVVFCGNSLGGHVAMRLALASPGLVSGLVLSGTSGLYEHSADYLPVRPDEKFVREHMARVFHNQQFVSEARIAEVTQILSQRRNVLNLIHAARSAKKDNLLKQLRNIMAPTLLLWGNQDAVTTMDIAETFKRELPNSELVTVEGCGHAPMIEHPRWFADQIKSFFERRKLNQA